MRFVLSNAVTNTCNNILVTYVETVHTRKPVCIAVLVHIVVSCPITAVYAWSLAEMNNELRGGGGGGVNIAELSHCTKKNIPNSRCGT